eukprot:COSAG02_NODE_2401_length_8945_cov_4.251752_7_plen_907_part_00
MVTRRAKSPARPGTLMARRQKKRESMGAAPTATTASSSRPVVSSRKVVARSPERPPRGGARPLGKPGSSATSPARAGAATSEASSAGGLAAGRARSPPSTPRTPVAKAADVEAPEWRPGMKAQDLEAELKEVQERNREREQEIEESEAKLKKLAQVRAADATPRPGGQVVADPPSRGEAEHMYSVVCPPGAQAGATIVLDGVGSAGKWEVEVDVPPGVNPGDVFEIALPDIQAGSVAALEPESELEPVVVKAHPLADGQCPTFRVAVTKGDNDFFGLLVDADDSGRCIIGGINDMGGAAANAGLLVYKGWLITRLGGQPCRTAEEGRDILAAALPNKPVEFVLAHPDAPAAAIRAASPEPKQHWTRRCWSGCCTCCAGLVWMFLLFVLPAVLIMSTGRIAFAEHDNVTSSYAAVLAGCVILLHLAGATALCGNRCRTLLCAWGTFLVGFGAACLCFVHLITAGLDYGIPVPVEAVAPNIAIIGAGTEGLAAAWMLQTAGTKFTLIAEGESFDDAARLVDFAPPGRPAPVRVDTSLRMLDPEDMDLAKIFGGYYSDAANQELEVRRIAPTIASTAEGWSSPLSVNQEIMRFNTLASADASDPGIVLWSLDYWLWHHGFSDAFQDEVLEPALHACYLTQGAVPTLKGPAIAYLRPFANAAWSLRGPGSLVTFEQQGVLGAGLLTAKHTERLGNRPADKGNSVTNSPLIDVMKSSGGYAVRAGNGTEGIDEKFDAVIINLDANDVAEKVVAAGYFARWAMGQVRYATFGFILHADVTQDIEEARLLADPERPSVFYSGDSSSSVTFDVCELTARSFSLASSTPPSPSQASACAGNRETLATFNRSPALATTAAADVELSEFEDSRQYRILDSWSTFFSVAVFPYFQGVGGLWYAGSWCVIAPSADIPVS